MRLPETVREFVRRRLLRPLLRQLRDGVTPQQLGWSLALGMVFGVNPSVGFSSLAVAGLAWVLGLNQIAGQVGVYAVAPIHPLLFVPFLQLGVLLFRSRGLPISREQIEHLSRHPLRLVHELWMWEWHAQIVWCVAGAVAMPLLATGIRRLVERLIRRHHTMIHGQVLEPEHHPAG